MMGSSSLVDTWRASWSDRASVGKRCSVCWLPVVGVCTRRNCHAHLVWPDNQMDLFDNGPKSPPAGTSNHRYSAARAAYLASLLSC